MRAAHRPSRRQQIIDAAIRVFGAEGVTTTTMADIAHECGVVAASMYYHFPNKEAVLTAAMEQIGAEIIGAQRRTHETAEGRDLGPRVRGVFHWSRDNPDKARLFYLWSVGVSPQTRSSGAGSWRSGSIAPPVINVGETGLARTCTTASSPPAPPSTWRWR